jgi:hypothetical protein
MSAMRPTEAIAADLCIGIRMLISAQTFSAIERFSRFSLTRRLSRASIAVARDQECGPPNTVAL